MSNGNGRRHFPIWKPDCSGDSRDQCHRTVRKPGFLAVHTGTGNPANVFSNQKATSALSPITAQAAEGMRNRQHMAIAHHNFASSQIFTQSIMTLGRTGTCERPWRTPSISLAVPSFKSPPSIPVNAATIFILPSYEARGPGRWPILRPHWVRALG